MSAGQCVGSREECLQVNVWEAPLMGTKFSTDYLLCFPAPRSGPEDEQ